MNDLPFIEDANEAAAALLSCMRQDLDFTASLCERHGITDFPGHFDPVFRILMGEWRDGRKYDWVTVARKLRKGGAANGSSADSIRPLLYEHHPIHAAESYAKTLAGAQAAFRLHRLGQELVQRSGERGGDMAGLLDYSARAMAEISKPPKDAAGGLSFRTPSELVGMAFDDTDIILANRVMSLGQSLVLAAAAGIGKSRMLLQLAACVVVGRPFLGMNVVSAGWPWLIFQTENSNRRLSFDLAKLKAWLGEGDFYKFNQRCHIHTLEKDEDSLLNIESGEAVDAMQAAIAKYPSQIVVFDPLNAFTTGNLNQDQDMRAVISTLARLSREGRTDRIPFFLHHALTGAGGAAKATGFDRSSFARNSKTLLAWTRAQINVAPATGDDNTRLVVACGKNSNGREFAPFGIVMDEETMIYDVDPDFNLDEWREEVDGKKKSPKLKGTCPPERVAEILKPKQPLNKAKLVNEITASCEITIPSAYRAIDRALAENTIRLEDGRVFFYSNL